jgi:hypothetical protein
MVRAVTRLIATLKAGVGHRTEAGVRGRTEPPGKRPAPAPPGPVSGNVPPPPPERAPRRPPPPPPRVEAGQGPPPPPPPAEGHRVVLLFGDGTTAEASDDPELAARMDYIAANLWARRPRP